MSAPPKPSQATAFYNAEHYDPSKLVPENSVGYLMRKVMSSIRTQADAQLSLHDLTYAQWLPLFKLSLCETATVATLARDLETDPASMTRSLDRMEAKGLLARVRSSEDRRVVNIVLTPEGERAGEQIPEILSRVQNRVLRGFSEDEYRALQGFLRRIFDNVQTAQPDNA